LRGAMPSDIGNLLVLRERSDASEVHRLRSGLKEFWDALCLTKPLRERFVPADAGEFGFLFVPRTARGESE